MDAEEHRLRTALLDMVSGAEAPTGAAVRTSARARGTRPVWVIGGAVTAIAVVVALAGGARHLPDNGAASQTTDTSVWDDRAFDHPEGWFVHQYGGVDRGPVADGPHLSTRELHAPCFQTGPAPPGCRLEPGDLIAQWRAFARPWNTVPVRPGVEETAPSGWLTKVHVTEANDTCRRLGGTVTMEVYVTPNPTSSVFGLLACLRSTDPETDQATIKTIATSLRENG